MPAKSGASHAVAAFVSILLGGLISDLLGTYATVFTDVGRAIGETVAGLVGLSIPATTTGHLVIATALAFAWGVAYHYTRHGPDSGQGENQQHGSLPSKATPTDRSTDDADIPAALTPIVTQGYRPDTASTADAEVLSFLETTLSDEVRRRLERAHDLLVEEEQRALADRVSALESDIAQLERALSPALDRSVTDPDRLQALKDGHVALVEAASALRSSTDSLASATREGRPEAAIADCREQYAALRDAQERRQRLIDQVSEIQ